MPLKALWHYQRCFHVPLGEGQVCMQVQLQEKKLRKNDLKWHSDLNGWIAGGFRFFYSQHIVRYPQRSATAHNILLLKAC